ncbi:MAG: hypothetical protein OXG04_13685 [Acidobacteria bacterium]|nr:hypothetical protein [Acidobacteriota bacterium]
MRDYMVNGQRIPAFWLAEKFPIASDERIKALADDILANDQISPVMIYGSGDRALLLDGRTRCLACELCGKEVYALPMSPYADPLKTLLSLNAYRRNMSELERALLAAEVSIQSRRGRPAKNAPVGGFSQEQAATAFDVSVRQLQRAKYCLGIPAILSALKAGVITLGDTDSIRRVGDGVRDAAVEAVRRGRASSLKEAVMSLTRETSAPVFVDAASAPRKPRGAGDEAGHLDSVTEPVVRGSRSNTGAAATSPTAQSALASGGVGAEQFLVEDMGHAAGNGDLPSDTGINPLCAAVKELAALVSRVDIVVQEITSESEDLRDWVSREGRDQGRRAELNPATKKKPWETLGGCVQELLGATQTMRAASAFLTQEILDD